MEIKGYIQIPYKWNGCTTDGCDCYGLLVLWFKQELGIQLLNYKYESNHYSEVLGSKVYLDGVHEEFQKVGRHEIQRHDVVLCRNVDNFHCGVVLDKYQFLHIMENCGAAVSRLARWKKRIIGFYRHKGLIK